MSYEYEIRKTFYFGTPQFAADFTRLKPDAVSGSDIIEAKYSDNFQYSIYNPLRKLPFPHSEVERNVEQAKNYKALAGDGDLIYYVNSRDLAEFYSDKFEENGLGRIRFIVVPAVRGGP